MDVYRRRLQDLIKAITTRAADEAEKEKRIGSVTGAIEILSEYYAETAGVKLRRMLAGYSEAMAKKSEKEFHENCMFLMDAVNVMNELNRICDEYKTEWLFQYEDVNGRELYPDERNVYDSKERAEAYKDKERAERELRGFFTEFADAVLVPKKKKAE